MELIQSRELILFISRRPYTYMNICGCQFFKRIFKEIQITTAFVRVDRTQNPLVTTSILSSFLVLVIGSIFVVIHPYISLFVQNVYPITIVS